jgi:DNA-binding transcriptional LysR family regulator
MKLSRPPEVAVGDLDVKWLRLFEQIYATRSVTRSAELLGQSQPTVSIWLGKLRERLDDALFVRTADGMLPTPRAQALIGPVGDALRALAEVAAPLAPFDPATSTRPWRICMTDASHATVLPRLFCSPLCAG